MVVYDDKIENSFLTGKNRETTLFGIAVSRGVALGRAICLHGRKRQFYRVTLDDNQIEAELRRLFAGLELAGKQLKKISIDRIQSTGDSRLNILDAHFLILEDKTLLKRIENWIKDRRVNAEWAVKIVFDSFIADYKKIPDEHLRERYIDLEDVSDRLLNALGGEEESLILPVENAVIVAKDVKPSTLIELAASSPQAVVTERGGWTSHTFILAREMNLPAVTGAPEILRYIETGDTVVVDGNLGKVIVSPSEKVFGEYKIAARKFQTTTAEKIVSRPEKFKTLDGQEIIVCANVDLPKGYLKAKQLGARGIGLYRSEFLFNQYKGFPSETEQIEAYRKIARIVGKDGVRIRTFDLSVERLADENSEREQNPALGLRGVRLSLSHSEQFRTQLRALLQAAFEAEIDILLPMISDVSEIMAVKQILREERESLDAANIRYGNPRLGAMIEVPSAVIMADEIARAVDFLSLGTNDLVQYLLAVDRDNQPVSEWFRTLHPAVIRAIKTVLTAAESNDTPLIVCGEMAGSPFYAPVLIGLGARILSMNVNSIARVGKIISGIALEDAREICRQLEKCVTADEAEETVGAQFNEKWSRLFGAEKFPKKIK